ncbi:hypothetical protein BH20PSE1_BH20PSE1_00950 [soil metagenome]
MRAINQTGEILKILELENGFNVSVFDPETPPLVPGQTPCQQQPIRWWRTYVFTTAAEVNTFVSKFLEGLSV